MKEAGVYGEIKSSPAVTLSYDAGQRFKSMDQGGGLVCFLYLEHGLNTHSNHHPKCFLVFWVDTKHSFILFSIYFLHLVCLLMLL